MEKILDAHGIEYKTVNGRIFAKSEYTINGVYGYEWQDVTDLKKKELFIWLGY